MKHVLVVGASSLIATHCLRIWLEKEPMMVSLVGRDSEKLKQIEDDLRVRQPAAKIDVFCVDFLDPIAITQLIASRAAEKSIDVCLIAQGVLPDQTRCQTDLLHCKDVLQINAISPVLFAEAVVMHMEQTNEGVLSIIGSVAGDRGRKSNYLYGAAKGLLARYVEGLRHRLAKSKVRILLVQPGPTDTPMTAHLKNTGAKMAHPAKVAKEIVAAIDAAEGVIYTPKLWRWIMRVIRWMPTPVFHRLNI